MLKRAFRVMGLAALGLALATAGVVVFFGGHVGRSEAQGIMAAPACQCSATTPIASMSTTVVHCICGSMSCVISEHKEPGKNTNLMQCVK